MSQSRKRLIVPSSIAFAAVALCVVSVVVIQRGTGLTGDVSQNDAGSAEVAVEEPVSLPIPADTDEELALAETADAQSTTADSQWNSVGNRDGRLYADSGDRWSDSPPDVGSVDAYAQPESTMQVPAVQQVAAQYSDVDVEDTDVQLTDTQHPDVRPRELDPEFADAATVQRASVASDFASPDAPLLLSPPDVVHETEEPQDVVSPAERYGETPTASILRTQPASPAPLQDGFDQDAELPPVATVDDRFAAPLVADVDANNEAPVSEPYDDSDAVADALLAEDQADGAPSETDPTLTYDHSEPTELAAPMVMPHEPEQAQQITKWPPAAPVVDANETTDSQQGDATGKPGPVELEGPQTPTLTLEKIAPEEIQVGKKAEFVIKVRNIGQIPAHEVLVRDEIPHGTRLVTTYPQAVQSPEGAVVWQMGTVKPGEEVTATMELTPSVEGQLGSVATVSFQASVSARSVATRPQLEIQQSGPRQVLIGQNVTIGIQLSNPGTGSANQVSVQEDVPEGLSHSAGNELEYEVGTLKPGEARQLELTLKAEKPGLIDNVLVARADANLFAESRVKIEVVAPQLKVEMQGPSRRYLEREATYTIPIANPGTAPAKNVELIVHLPRGVNYVNTNNAGYYDEQGHAVHWSLAELPAGEAGDVQLIVLPTDIGEHKLRVEAKAEMGLVDAIEKTLAVEGIVALYFGLADVTDPIEVGGQTTYEIRVVNQGSKIASNLQLTAAVPPGMKAIGGDGPTRVAVEGQRVVFEPLARLAPKDDAIYQVHVEGVKAGDQRFRAQLVSDAMTQPVTKEESTRVYADD